MCVYNINNLDISLNIKICILCITYWLNSIKVHLIVFRLNTEMRLNNIALSFLVPTS